MLGSLGLLRGSGGMISAVALPQPFVSLVAGPLCRRTAGTRLADVAIGTLIRQ